MIRSQNNNFEPRIFTQTFQPSNPSTAIEMKKNIEFVHLLGQDLFVGWFICL